MSFNPSFPEIVWHVIDDAYWACQEDNDTLVENMFNYIETVLYEAECGYKGQKYCDKFIMKQIILKIKEYA